MEDRQKLSTVLIIDDAPENIKILMESLKNDFRLLAATDAEKGFELAQSEDQPPDIILLDILMPDIDGYELCKQLKQNWKTKNIPIIFVTAVSEVMDAATGFKLGAVDYITKPFHPPVVKERIKTHLALLKKTKELKEVNATKDKLFSTISHDMRNKFATLLTSIDLLEKCTDTLDRESMQETLSGISSSSKQMYDLFENLFTWARAQNKRIDIAPLEVILSQSVLNTIDLYKDEATAIAVLKNMFRKKLQNR